jgi:cytoskeletal protein RodZ
MMPRRQDDLLVSHAPTVIFVMGLIAILIAGGVTLTLLVPHTHSSTTTRKIVVTTSSGPPLTYLSSTSLSTSSSTSVASSSTSSTTTTSSNSTTPVSLNVDCVPAIVSPGQMTQCTVTVVPDNPKGTVSWSQSPVDGKFNNNSCKLNGNGQCNVDYTLSPATTSSITVIEATYDGASASFIVFTNNI